MTAELLEQIALTPAHVELERLHEVLADVELEAFGAAKPTDSSCYGAQQPCVQTCC